MSESFQNLENKLLVLAFLETTICSWHWIDERYLPNMRFAKKFISEKLKAKTQLFTLCLSGYPHEWWMDGMMRWWWWKHGLTCKASSMVLRQGDGHFVAVTSREDGAPYVRFNGFHHGLCVSRRTQHQTVYDTNGEKQPSYAYSELHYEVQVGRMSFYYFYFLSRLIAIQPFLLSLPSFASTFLPDHPFLAFCFV